MWPVPGGDNYAIRDLATGKDEWLLPTGVAAGANGWPSGVRGSTLGEFGYWWNSPVGNSTDGLWLMRWPSREARQLHTGDYYPAGWSRDGRALFAYKYLGREILRFSGEASTPIGSFPVGALDGCDVTPDASSVICSLRETNSDAWIVDHVVRRARP
jgi:hypothetical protein